MVTEQVGHFSDLNKQLMDGFIKLSKAVLEDITHLIDLYESGKVSEALEEGEKIVGGIYALGNDPRLMIGLSILYPPMEMDPRETLDTSRSIN